MTYTDTASLGRLLQPHAERKLTLSYPVPVGQGEDIGKILLPLGREVEWEFTDLNSGWEMLKLTATRSVHAEIFRIAMLTKQMRKRIEKVLAA